MFRHRRHTQRGSTTQLTRVLASAPLDDSVGTLLATLRERKLDTNTLVLFISDNGGPTAELTSSNGPLRGGKGQLYEGGIRVPFFARWSGNLPAGRIFSHPVSSLDITATALASSGSSVPTNLDGVNLLPHWRGEITTPPHSTLYWRYGPSYSLREGHWKLVLQRTPGGGSASKLQLFDLEADPGETADLSAREAARVAVLLERWQALDEKMVPPIK